MMGWGGGGNQHFICIQRFQTLNKVLTFCTVHQAVTRFQPLFREISFSKKNEHSSIHFSQYHIMFETSRN